MLTGTVIAYEKSEFGFSIMVEDGDTFQTVGIPINMVREALECDENSVEDTLSIRIPFSVAVGTTNGIVSSFALVWTFYAHFGDCHPDHILGFLLYDYAFSCIFSTLLYTVN